MHKPIALSVVASLSLAACAERPENVQSQYVSPLAYQSLSCSQLEQEARRVSARAAQATGQQQKRASDDAVATGVALVVFWPALFFIGGDKGNAAELSRLKGELEALEQASIQKNCGIVFQRPEPQPNEQEKSEQENSDRTRGERMQ